MGMFDYIRCEMLLPETPIPAPDGLFQTKDTDDQYLTEYTITADGLLMWRPYHMELVPANERPYPDPSHPFHGSGSMRRVEGEPEAVPFDGDLIFYTCGSYERRDWWEYKARFVNGRTERIELVEFTAA